MKERIILFTAHSKLIIRCLPFLLSFILFFIPLNVCAADGAPYGDYTEWDGIVKVRFPAMNVQPSFRSNNSYTVNGSSVQTSSYIANYETIIPGIITLETLNVDSYYYGKVEKYFQLNCSLPSGVSFYSQSTVWFEPYVTDDIVVSVQNATGGYNPKMLVRIQFKGYKAFDDTLEIPINLHVSLSCTSSTGDDLLTFIVNPVSLDDYAGFLYEYSDIRDIPTYDGLIVEQNSEVINNTTINNDLLQQQIQQDHQDTVDQTNQLTNGYQSSLVGSAENDFNAGAGQLTGIEDTLSDSSTQYVDSFTSTGFDDSLLDSIAPSMQYVVTWFTNFWNMGGALTKCFTLCFALYIAFFILRVRS